MVHRQHVDDLAGGGLDEQRIAGRRREPVERVGEAVDFGENAHVVRLAEREVVFDEFHRPVLESGHGFREPGLQHLAGRAEGGGEGRRDDRRLALEGRGDARRRRRRRPREHRRRAEKDRADDKNAPPGGVSGFRHGGEDSTARAGADR